MSTTDEPTAPRDLPGIDRTSSEYREAFREEGRRAYRAAGKAGTSGYADCPYHRGHIEGREWRKGYREAREADHADGARQLRQHIVEQILTTAERVDVETRDDRIRLLAAASAITIAPTREDLHPFIVRIMCEVYDELRALLRV